MKNMRKIISLVLCSIMVFSLFVFSAAAAETCSHMYSATNVAPSCVEDGYTLYVCPLCGDNYKDYQAGVSALGHNYGPWYNVDKATCTEEGHDHRDCLRCGASEVKTLGILEHYDADSDGKCDTCEIVLDTEVTISPFDWLVALFNFIRQWFADLFS